MLEHLVQFFPDDAGLDDFVSIAAVSSANLLSAQIATAELLDELGVTPDDRISYEAQTNAARNAFKGMLTAYDWEFVQQAKELRGYTVAKLLEECENPNANIRLKALGLLGKVTEVGLFTDKIEVKKTDLTDEEIDKKLKDKLAKFMNVTDAEPIEDIEVSTPSPKEPDES
jgi:hypothetical protein